MILMEIKWNMQGKFLEWVREELDGKGGAMVGEKRT